eukprot:TRINITY_DN4156_c0_g1_i7.p3 TRINITY_DN4156_c0_g1~~TRINITY_DN4156_c0_g1_i7.p3  ORF type:complete len:702 (+),score=172.94 TRINITY_DN4156_c0_g1_i7:12581-14686(+)
MRTLYTRCVLLVVLFNLLTVSLHAPSAYGQENGPVPDMLEESDSPQVLANLEGVLLIDFIRFVSRFTGRNIVYRADQIPKLTFNIYSHEAISEPELMAIFQQTLDSAGLAAVYKEGSLFIQPATEAKRMEGDVRVSVEGAADAALVTTVYKLARNVSSSMAASALQGLISPVGNLSEIPQAQALLITDKAERIEKLLSVLRMVEQVRPESGFTVINLDKASADTVAPILQNMYAELVKSGETGTAPFISPLDWSNSLMVMGPADQRAYVRQVVASMDQADERQGMIRVYRLQNAKASSLAEVLRSLVEAKTGKADGQEQRIATSDIFSVSHDEETNSLVVLSSNALFPQIEDIIEQLDTPQDQVYVEALVMETSLNRSRDFGVEWLTGMSSRSGDITGLGTVGFVDGGSSGSLVNLIDPVLQGESSSPAVSALPGGFSVGVLGNIITFGDQVFTSVAALVNYAKSVEEINILATPQIMTLDNSEAEVFVGQEVPYTTSEKFDANNNPVNTFEYRDVGIKLKVTPHINIKRRLIRLEVEQEVKQVVSVDQETLAPTSLNRFTKTTVQLMDGATMVISGLVQNDRSRGKTGIPGVASVPVLGWLFKRETSSRSKSTIMVFLSAHIIQTLETVQALTKAKEIIQKKADSDYEQLYESEFQLFGDTPPGVDDETGVWEGPGDESSRNLDHPGGPSGESSPQGDTP